MFSAYFLFIFVPLIVYPSINGIHSFRTSKKDWDYKVLSSEITINCPDCAQGWVKLTRISRGIYGLTGNITLLKGKFGDNSFMQLDGYRSPRNDGDFQRLPYKMSKTPYWKFMNEHYKTFIMDTLKECSNAPVFQNYYNESLKEGECVTFKDCLFKENDATPPHFQPGYYKLIGKAIREPDLEVTLTVLAQVFTI